MVLGAGLDPTALHWSHFHVAEIEGEIVGVGQIRPKACELGSLVVKESWRGQGIGGQLIRSLLATQDSPVYLECRASLAPYYAQFGFEEIDWREAPVPLRFKAGAGHLMSKLFNVKLAVMRHPQDKTP